MPASSSDATATVEPTRLRLADVVADQSLIDQLDRAQLAGALVEVSALLARLAGRATALGQVEARDVLLTADQLAAWWNTSEDYVRHGNYPFAIKIGGLTRYSQKGAERWIEKRTGTKTWHKR